MTAREARSNPNAAQVPPRTELDELRAAEERARQENEHLRESQAILEQASAAYFDLYDSALAPLLTLDLQGNVRHANRAAAALLGRHRTQIIGHAFRTFVVPEKRSFFAHHLNVCQETHAGTCELELLRVVGNLPVRLATQVVRRGDGALIHAFLSDLSERDAIARERQALRDVAQSARLASESKDQFIAMLSHELRTPLTPILAAASTFASDPSLTPALRAVFERIERNANAEARLVDDLLDVSGISRGKMHLVEEPADVHELLAECISACRDDAECRGHSLSVQLDAELHHVIGDPLRLRQIFTNLLRNAIKYTPAGGRIDVRSWNREDEQLVVDVADTGIGFQAESVPRLFAAFEQLEATDTPRTGLGLGLAISKGLVDLHGGTIEATSRGLGCGARFTISLPTIEAPAAPSRKIPSTPPPSHGRQTKLRVLLVEDHADSAELLTELLEMAGHQVTVASSVKAGLDVDLETVDLIVSDIGLPDGSGLKLLENLHRVRKLPAIALSGFGMKDDVQASKAAGFDLHLTKPIDMTLFLKAIHKLAARFGKLDLE